MPQFVTYRDATPSDIEWLVRLRVETMSPHFDAAGERLSSEDQSARVLQDFECIRIIERGERAIGMIKVVRDPDAWRLVQIQIDPGFQGIGIGERVIRDLLAEARASSAPVRLSVLKVNPAKRLYERLGFVTEGESERSFRMVLATRIAG